MLLPLAGAFPFRCADCGSRFYRFRPQHKRDARKLLSDPPAWVRTTFWLAVALALAIAVAFVIVRFVG